MCHVFKVWSVSSSPYPGWGGPLALWWMVPSILAWMASLHRTLYVCPQVGGVSEEKDDLDSG